MTEPFASAARPEPADGPLTDFDVYLFREGSHARLFERFGAHLGERGGRPGAIGGHVGGQWLP